MAWNCRLVITYFQAVNWLSAVLVDAIGRLLPGVLNDETSALLDILPGQLASATRFIDRPATFRDWKVPEVLLSGNFAKIDEWRNEKSMERTNTRRPDLLEGNND